MVDKTTPPQGMMAGDNSATGGSRVSLLNENHTPGNPHVSSDRRGWLLGGLGTAVVVVLAVIGGVLAFGGEDEPEPGPPIPTVSPSESQPTATSPVPTPSAKPDDLAISGATAGYKAWRAVQDKAAMSGGIDAPEARLASVAVGTQLQIDRFIANTYYKKRGRKMVTPATVVSFKPVSLGTPDSNGIIKTVTLAVCVDVSKSVVLENGKVPTVKNRPHYLIDTAKMVLVSGAWKNSDLSNKPSGACP